MCLNNRSIQGYYKTSQFVFSPFLNCPWHRIYLFQCCQHFSQSLPLHQTIPVDWKSLFMVPQQTFPPCPKRLELRVKGSLPLFRAIKMWDFLPEDIMVCTGIGRELDWFRTGLDRFKVLSVATSQSGEKKSRWISVSFPGSVYKFPGISQHLELATLPNSNGMNVNGCQIA